MKKLFAMMLAVAMVMSMVVSASAAAPANNVESPVAETTALPTVVTDGDNNNIIFELTATEDAEELTEEKQEVYTAAQDALDEAAPEDMFAVTSFYFQAFAVEENGNKTAINEPVDVTLDISEVSEKKDFTEVRVMQFVDGKWVDLEVVINPDGTITIKGVVEGPIAIFVK